MPMEFSQSGIIFMVVIIALMILISIQFTLNQILKELRELKKKVEREQWNSSQRSYRGREWDE